MSTTTKDPSFGAEDYKYGAPSSCRLPADLKLEMIREARQVGMKFAPYMATQVLAKRKSEEEKDLEVDKRTRQINALRELELIELREEVRQFKAQALPIRKEDQEALSILFKNREVLENIAGKTTRLNLAKLKAQGFNLGYPALCFIELQGKLFNCLFNMAYRIENDQVTVINLNLLQA